MGLGIMRKAKGKILEYDDDSPSLVFAHDHEQQEEQQKCDFCGRDLEGIQRGERRKYCSKTCRTKAARGWTAVRLGIPVSKRRITGLKFSNRLYFD